MFQDDSREKWMIDNFSLQKSPGRNGVDAILNLSGRILNFELKTTSKDSVSTARDVSFNMIQKWKTLHWLISVYQDLRYRYSIYSPPTYKPLSNFFRLNERRIERSYQVGEKVLEMANEYLPPDDIKLVDKIIKRGATLNNPKIPLRIFKDLPIIDQDKKIRGEMVGGEYDEIMGAMGCTYQ